MVSGSINKCGSRPYGNSGSKSKCWSRPCGKSASKSVGVEVGVKELVGVSVSRGRSVPAT